MLIENLLCVFYVLDTRKCKTGTILPQEINGLTGRLACNQTLIQIGCSMLEVCTRYQEGETTSGMWEAPTNSDAK